MVRGDFARVVHTCRLHQFLQRMQGLLVEVVNAFSLVGHHQRLLAQRVLRGHAGGAVAGVAVLCLDAAQCKHEAACAVAPVGTQGHESCNVKRAHDFARAAHFDALPQASTAQRVVHQQQSFLQRRAYVIGELQWRRAGATFGSVHHNEIGRDTGFQHRLDHGKPLPGVANAEFETGGFATREFAQLGDELHHFYWRGERAVGGR